MTDRALLDLIAERLDPEKGCPQVDNVDNRGPEWFVVITANGWAFRLEVECLGYAGDANPEDEE